MKAVTEQGRGHGAWGHPAVQFTVSEHTVREVWESMLVRRGTI
ncbi:hypothetical protein AB5J72_42080 [Streptomyces sp. CG1]